MNPSEFPIMLSLIIVRLGIPIAVMLAVIWALRRLDWQWQRTSRPLVSGACDAAPEASQPNFASRLGPCWEFKACPEEKRTKCPVFQTRADRCWLMYLQRDGRVTGNCRTCGLFAATTITADASHAH